MADLELTEIVQAGVGHLENWLNDNGYKNIEVNIWQSGSADIKANGQTENILVQLKPVLHPNEQAALNGTDKFALKDLAERLERIPYIAYLIIDGDKNLVGEIIWERLN
jgi:DNA modification methylase